MQALRIIYRTSAYQGRELTLAGPIVRLGRDPACHVPFDETADRAVSRLHAEIQWDGQAAVLTPAPGRVVLRQRQPLTGPTLLLPGDVLELCGPGGPAIEVVYQRRNVIGGGAPVDDNAVTVTGLQAWRPPEPAPAPAPVAQPPPVATEPAPPRPLRQPQPKPADDGAVHTMMLRAPDLEAQSPHQTQLLAMPVILPQAEPPKKQWTRAISVGALVVVGVFGLALGGWLWSRAEKRRQAVERVERMQAALALGANAPRPSAEDLAIYEEEVKKKRVEPSAPAVPDPAAQQAAREEEARRAEEARRKTEAEASEKKRKAEEAARARSEVRAIFAQLKRNELARLALGRGGAAARREQLALDRKQLLEDYDEAAQRLGVAPAAGSVEAVVRATARYLGECDAAMPPKFLSEVTASVHRLRNDGEARERLTSTLKRAADLRYGPTITAALGDQGVPVELFFLPYRASGFDDHKVGEPTAQGIPKGMWQLAPAVATKAGLKVGPLAQEAEFDPADERHRYEKEARAVAKLLRDVYRGPAAGSALLILAAFDHGDDGTLKALKQRAGLSVDDADPERVSYWRLYEAGALSDEQRRSAAELFALVAIASEPAVFNLPFPTPLKHVAMADAE